MINSKKIYLMRHGLDDESFVGGWSSGKLIDEGIKQVEKVAHFLSTNIDDINVIYHSGLKRAVQTADIINKSLKLSVFVLDDLKEMNKGKLNGMELNRAKEIYPDFFPIKSIKQRYPNGESLVDLYNRVNVFLKEIDQYDKFKVKQDKEYISNLDEQLEKYLKGGDNKG